MNRGDLVKELPAVPTDKEVLRVATCSCAIKSWSTIARSREQMRPGRQARPLLIQHACMWSNG